MLSLIIPCYNEASNLKKVLAGFANQEAVEGIHYEIVLIDNNSHIESIRSCYEKYFCKLNVYLIYQPKLPTTYALCRARNLGMKIANNPWIVTFDSDCIPNTRYISTLTHFLEGKGSGEVMITGERIFVSTEEYTDEDFLKKPGLLEQLPRIKSASNYYLPFDRRLPYFQSKLDEQEHPWSFMLGCNTIFHRDDALLAGNYDEGYDGRWGYEDIDFAYRLLKKTHCKPIYLPGIHIYHQEASVTNWNNEWTNERMCKKQNDNWHRICTVIPGFKEFKEKQYREINPGIIV